MCIIVLVYVYVHVPLIPSVTVMQKKATIILQLSGIYTCIVYLIHMSSQDIMSYKDALLKSLDSDGELRCPPLLSVPSSSVSNHVHPTTEMMTGGGCRRGMKQGAGSQSVNQAWKDKALKVPDFPLNLLPSRPSVEGLCVHCLWSVWTYWWPQLWIETYVRTDTICT